MAKSKPHSFKVFFSDDSSNQLNIPQAFGEHIKVGSSSRVSLEGPGGNILKVHLAKKSDGFFFEDGWKEFVADHSLVTGDLLLFRYDGNSRFRVVVFDSTACEKKKAFLGKPSLEDQEVRVVEESEEAKEGMLIGEEDENKPLALFMKRVEGKLKRKRGTNKKGHSKRNFLTPRKESTHNPSETTIMAKRRDWAHFPHDLQQEIVGRLPEISDRIRYYSVCIQWRSVPIPKSLPLQLPWLLLSYNSFSPEDHYNDDEIRFFSISENRTYAIPLPGLRDHKIFPTPNGWLAAVSHKLAEDKVEYSILILNPITRFSIQLPPLSVWKWLVIFPPTQNCNVKLFGSASSDLVVGLFLNDCSSIHFCRPGESAWSKIYTMFDDRYGYGDFIIHNDKLIVVNLISSMTGVFNMKTSEMVSRVEQLPKLLHKFSYCNLVESPFGELLLVLWSVIPQRKSFELFRLDESQEKLKWVKVTSIGDCTLFVTYLHAMCFNSSDIKGIRSNCIYFVDKIGLYASPKDYTVRLFDIENGQVERDPFFSYEPLKKFVIANWFMPSLC